MGNDSETIVALQQHVSELEQQLARYRSLIDQLPLGIHIYHLEDPADDTTLRMIDANPAVEHLTGIVPEQVIGHTLDENFPDLRTQGVPQLYANVIQAGELHTFEVVYGDERVIESAFDVRAMPLPGNCLAVSFDNITQRKQAEQEVLRLHAKLQEQLANQHLEQVFAATPLATIEFGLDGRITRWNASAERIFGWSATEVMGQELLPLVVTAEAMPHVEAVRDALFKGQFTNSQNENVTRDGRIITCRWHNTVMHDQTGQVIGVLAQAEDITEQVQQEHELRIFRTMVERAPYSISISSLDSVLTYANLAHQLIHGYPTSTVGLRFAQLMPNATELHSALTNLSNEGHWHGLITHQRMDGSTFPMQCDAFFVYNQDGEPTAIVVIERDMSEDLRQEEERLALKQQVIEAQQSAIRELSTPLIPLADNVLAMPLIGIIDRTRAQMVMETLLEGIALYQASVVIVDITGVRMVDTQVAQALIQTAQAVKLLGAQVILTGIQPQIAQTLVTLGVDLQGIVPCSTLQAGIDYALHGSE